LVLLSTSSRLFEVSPPDVVQRLAASLAETVVPHGAAAANARLDRDPKKAEMPSDVRAVICIATVSAWPARWRALQEQLGHDVVCSKHNNARKDCGGGVKAIRVCLSEPVPSRCPLGLGGSL
jgi:hypothetical protein